MGKDCRASRLLYPPRNCYPSTSEVKHDESGQVFTEKLCHGGPMTADWAWKTKGSSREAGKFRSLGPGCSSLVNMAIRKVLCNSSTLTAESLNGVPWEIASQIWQKLGNSQLDSVQTWKAFASAYPSEASPSLRCRHQVIENPNMGLRDYVRPVSSLSFNWITFLTLSNTICSRTDLIQISQLPNIGALTIGPNAQAEEIGFDDSIIRSWARIAATSNAFSMLRVLSCRFQKDITHRIFSHLNHFPALAIFNVEKCELGPQNKADALCQGWKYRTGKELSDCLVKGGANDVEWDSIVHASFRLGGPYNVRALTMEGVDIIDGLPRLHLSIGAVPKPAVVDVSGNCSLKSFYRAIFVFPQQNVIPASLPNKRPLRLGHIPVGNRANKKPTIRESKQQNMEGLLTELGG